MTLTISYRGESVTLDSNTQTEYGENQIWIPLSDGSSLELTEECDGDAPLFYSLRLHVSSEELDNGACDSTNGVALSLAYDTIPELEKELASLLADLDVAGVQPDLT